MRILSPTRTFRAFSLVLTHIWPGFGLIGSASFIARASSTRPASASASMFVSLYESPAANTR